MIRRALPKDIDEIMDIVHSAQLSLRELGIDQWQDGYPTRQAIEDDVAQSVGYVCICDDSVVGYAAIVLTGEPAYEQIADSWHYGNNYVVVHRLCISGSHRRRGIALDLMRYAADMCQERGYRAFRIDTHEVNTRMLSMLEKLGFEYRGVILYDSGKRVAYELDLNTNNTL